jgi:hypothetical protein
MDDNIAGYFAPDISANHATGSSIEIEEIYSEVTQIANDRADGAAGMKAESGRGQLAQS